MAKRTCFTMIEVIISAVLISILVVGMAFFFFANRRSLHSARIRREATWKAIERMEELKDVAYDSLKDEDGTEPIELPGKQSATIKTTVGDEINPYNYKEVIVTVTYNGSEVELVTYIADF